MYGDCQVMSNIGGNMVSSETFFSSTPVQNPNFNFTTFHSFPPIVLKEENGLLMRSKEDMESGSGSEQVEEKSGNELESSEQQQRKKKRYHRQTARQIQEMEALFKECPHPDAKQRMKLSQDLGLKPRQVKFWFQNRRTQMKAQKDRVDNLIIRAKNETLKNENYRLQVEFRSVICSNCGGPATLGEICFEDLHLENARLRDENAFVVLLRDIVVQAIGPSPIMPPWLDLDMNIYSRHFAEPMDMMPLPMLPENSVFPETGLILMEEEKSIGMELAMSSMDELVKMCQENEPLWIRSNENGKEILNIEEHARTFPWPLNLKQYSSEFRTEATRDTAVVIMNSITLVDTLLDANKWMELFPSIVARAKTVQVIASGVSCASSSLQLMHAELQVLSPLVPTRQAHFLRYCQQNVEEGTWAIVDFPIDSFQENIQLSFPLAVLFKICLMVTQGLHGFSMQK